MFKLLHAALLVGAVSFGYHLWQQTSGLVCFVGMTLVVLFSLGAVVGMLE